MPVGNPITDLSGPGNYVPVTRQLTINGVSYDLSADRSWTVGGGSVTSIGMTVPTGFSVAPGTITTSGTFAVTFTAGYSLPTTAKQTQWDSAYTFTNSFPTGTAQQLLRYNTLGTALEFFTPSFIVPTDIIATTPLVWNSGTKTMSIPQANNTTNGFLASTDWLTFSSKQNAITLTTTGSSGSATLIGSTLNVPTYTLVGLGGMANPFSAAIGQTIYSNSAGAPLSLPGNTTTTKKYLSQTGDGTNSDAPFWDTITAASLGAVPTSRTLTINGTTLDLSANRTFSVGTVTSVGLSSSTSGVTIGSSPVTTSGTITLAIATASGSSNGLLSSTDWSAFTAKMNNPFSAALGQIIYSNGAGAALALSGNITTTKRFLSQTGNGSSSAAPVWSTIAIGDVSGAIGLTALSATSPLLYNNTTGVFSIQQASNLQDGFLSAANWTTFNSKQTQITLTTTGNSGSSTFNFSTGALNIPTYTLAGLGGLSNPMTSLGDMIYGNGAGAPQRLAPNTTTTRKYLSMIGTGTDGAIPTWETISGIAGSGTTNYIAKFTGSSTVGNSLIFDTGTNIGINTATPTTISNYISLHMVGGPSGSLIRFSDSTAANRGTIYGSTSETAINAVAQFNLYVDNTTTLNATSSGNVKIGGVSATAKFEVNNGSLSTNGSGFMVSGGLTNGRLDTYQAGTANCIHTYLDNNTYEISCGSTAGWISGISITGRNATLNPGTIRMFTHSNQRFQIDGTGKLSLNNYTALSSFPGTAVGYLGFDSSGNIITSNPSSGRSLRIAFSAEVPNTWSNMPNTLQFFDSSSAYVTQIDLTAYNQVRLIVNKQGTAGATGSKLLLRYQATSGAPFTESSYSAIGTSEVSVAVDTTNNILTSSWTNLASGAIGDVWVALMGIDGDTTADPVFGNIYAEFRYN